MTRMRKAAAMFGGAAALALTVGFGGLAVDNVTSATAATTPSSANGTPALPGTGASGVAADAGSNVHTAILTGCVVTSDGCG
jgi:hypothetical protein